jgi:HK97 family phage prohead protease
MKDGNPKEVRFVGQMRASGSESKPVLQGYAVVYGSKSLDLGGFKEVIQPGAFTRCLRSNPDIFCIADHDKTKILGRTSAGTLRLKDDSHGLGFSLDVPNTTLGNDIYESVKRGDIRGCSFCFRAVDEDWSENSKDNPQYVRTVNDADLLDEITVTAWPAYQATNVSARSLWPNGRPEHTELRNLARTVKNHTKGLIQDAAFRADAQRRAQAILDEHAEWEQIEAQRRRFLLSQS